MTQDSIINKLESKNELLLKTIDSLKIQNQLDKLTYKIENQNSIATEVNAFYDSAWLKLIVIITILGIIVPIIVQYFQRKNFKDLIEGIKDKFDTKIETLKENNEIRISSLIEKYENRIDELEAKNEKALIELDANTYYLQGRALFTEKNFFSSVGSNLKSALLLKRCGRIDRIIPTLNNVKRALNHFTDEQFQNLDQYLLNNSEKKNFEQTLRELELNLSEDSMIHLKTDELRKLIREKNGA